MKLNKLFLEAKKLQEDGEGGAAGMSAAAVGAGDTSGASGEASSVDVVDNQSGIRNEDVLGKWDPAKGFMAKGDFHIPKNVLGKGKILKRYEIPSKKKKGLKNPYVKGMKIIEKEIDEGRMQHSYSGAASKTIDKLYATIDGDVYIDTPYFVKDFGFAWKLNNKGYVHIYMPTKVSINKEFMHYAIKHVMLTDKNELKDINSFGNYPDKETTLRAIEDACKNKNSVFLKEEGEPLSDIVYDIHSMEHKDIVDFVKTVDPTANIIIAIAFYPKSDIYFIKYFNTDRKSNFIAAKLVNKKFELTKEFGNRLLTLNDVKKIYDIINDKPNMWVIWGELR